MSGQYQLTPADILDLRTWRAKNAHSCAFTVSGVSIPYIVCSPSDGTLYLTSAGGNTIAGGLSPAALCAALIQERLEPGWCISVCDPACTIEEALRTPEERRAIRQRQEAARASARLRSAEEAAETIRRSTQVHQDHTNLSLDDLISTL